MAANFYDIGIARKLGGAAPASLQEKSVSITQNGDSTILPDSGYDGMSKVDVSVNVSGGGEAPENDVEFIDYDGRILYSYTAQEFLALTEMPANPTHEGLTAQGWNWTLADAKAYVADVGGLVIGQMYITDDGKTRIYISFPDGTPAERRVATFRFYIYSGGGADKGFTFNAGDGSADERVTGTGGLNKIVTYANNGTYQVTILPDDDVVVWLGAGGTSTSTVYPLLGFYNTSSNSSYMAYNATIYKIELGKNIGISNGGLQCQSALKSISIPQGARINRRGFSSCVSLSALVFPLGVEDFGILSAVFCNNLRRISLPSDTTTASGTATGCPILSKYYFPKITNLTNNSLEKNEIIRKIVLPTGVEGIDSIFNQAIGLTTIELPSTLSTIASNSISSNYSLGALIFHSTIPPVLASSSAINIPLASCVIYVPYSEDHSVLNAYKTATNYPNPSTYTYVEY